MWDEKERRTKTYIYAPLSQANRDRMQCIENKSTT